MARETLLDKIPDLSESSEEQDFTEIGIDYTQGFLPTDLSKFRERTQAGKEIVATVIIGIPEALSEFDESFNSEQLAMASILLGKRNGIWAPVMGKIDEKDVKAVFSHDETEIFPGQEYLMRDLIKDNAFREVAKEIKGLPEISTISFAAAFHHQPTDRNIYVTTMVVRAIGQSSFPAVSPRSDEHSEFAWFKPEELPQEMELGSRKSLIAAVTALSENVEEYDERNASLVQMQEHYYNYFFPVSTAYLLWLQEAAAEFAAGDPRKDLLLQQFIQTKNSLEEELRKESLYKNSFTRQIAIVMEKGIAVSKDIATWDKERLESCLEGWWQLMNWQNWFPKSNPFFAILPRAYSDLPRFIALGDKPYQRLQRRFDQTYIPDKDMISNEMMALVFDQLAEVYERETFVDREIKSRVMKTILDKAGVESLPVGSKILDVGVGTGFSANFIPNCYQIIGVDISSKMLEYAGQRGIQSVQADAAHLPFPDDAFPVVFSSYGLNWFKGEEKPFLEMKRVLAKNGVLSFNYHRTDDDWKKMKGRLLKVSGEESLDIEELEIVTKRGKYRENFLVFRKGK